MKRFALHPGYVISPNDGDRHYITFRALCDLHGIDPREAVDMSREPWYRGLDTSKLLHLHASDNGAGYWHVSELERSLYPTK